MFGCFLNLYPPMGLLVVLSSSGKVPFPWHHCFFKTTLFPQSNLPLFTTMLPGDSQASLLETLISNSLDTSMFPELSNGFASQPVKTKGNSSFGLS